MVSTSSFLFLFYIIILMSLLPVFAANSSLSSLCHYDEMSALLQFRNSFVIDMQASSDPLAYAKVKSWKHHDCCSWDGVTCNKQTGHVIGLDLSSSFLYGSINSTSSLFRLVYLHSLNLADNNFNYSLIPSELGYLSKLTYLNLAASNFVGQIPSTFSHLSKLHVLDLTWNDDLILKNPDFGSLVKNFTSLEDLSLGYVDISSTVPNILANLSSIKSLRLSFCGLYGQFPIEIFHLPNLQTLTLGRNSNLKGHLPEFNSSSQLQILMVPGTSFSGELPTSIGNLASLNVLDISDCKFFGQLPASLGSVVELVIMDLGNNNFEVKNSSSLSWIGKLTELNYLSLSRISFNNEFPSFFANITRLTYLSLEHCQINNQIPSWFMNMTQLSTLQIPNNELQGPIPDSIYQLRNLKILALDDNNLSGTVELATFFSKLKKLNQLYLSDNNILLLDNVDSNTTVGKFLALGFRPCNLSHFPSFLRHQDELRWLDFSNNYLHGQVPEWLWNSSIDTLKVIDLSGNFLTGFEQDPRVFLWTQVIYLDLCYNMLQGLLPIPSSSIEIYFVAQNNLSGEVSPAICRLNALRALDLSDNHFTGTLPHCLGKFSTIQFLHLGGNGFHGKFPQVHIEECNIRMLSIDSNELEGEVPRSLAKCTKLEFLILGGNKIKDVFPSWLGALKELKVLILRSNKFHGTLENHITDFDFPKLCIIDISYNNFSGKLPAQYFRNWNAMKKVGEDQLAYMGALVPFVDSQGATKPNVEYSYSMTITNKGTKLKYPKIIESFVAIDFSCNKFEGGIPEEIGQLSGLRLLNISSNNLSGGIPTSLGNLRKLESLDLSRNNFIGEIPQQLTQLGFLAFFNVSYNNLTGPIPHGKQFDTFQDISYQNNSNLCGNPLSRKCENSKALPPFPSSIEEDQDLGPFIEFDWVVVAFGYGSGLIVGVIVGHFIVTRNYKWFMKTFKIRHGRVARSRMHKN